MEYVKATEKDIDQISMIVQDTIRDVYPKYYPKEVVDFFCELHCKKNISKDIKNGLVGMLRNDNMIVGTGCYKDNHITRVYVKPEFQGKGYGSFIMQCLENQISLQYDTVYLDASLPASHLYEKRGYRTIKHERLNVEKGRILVYEVMMKLLRNISMVNM
ncbi:GNAT family N-acetyltransferase [Dorea sp. D27]|uniref:GNAT family N-acetyltransferase n=1 Tax=Dorea sp. D27 TaxID=658665 RepID=UPI00067393D6|nr:GNAT family N-acetyltransferase [Dorea sp. D27]KMZ55784.1 acetyltransferase, GNAT family [Dorea sp. D27]